MRATCRDYGRDFCVLCHIRHGLELLVSLIIKVSNEMAKHNEMAEHNELAKHNEMAKRLHLMVCMRFSPMESTEVSVHSTGATGGVSIHMHYNDHLHLMGSY